MIEFVQQLLEAGILQFGHFKEGTAFTPLHLSFELLPAYPDLLQNTAARVVAEVNTTHVDHFISTPDSIPLGVALSLQTNIPLVYSHGSKAAPVYDLVGAYDSGHPAIMLANSVEDVSTLSGLLRGAREIGLETHTLVTILDLEIVHPTELDITMKSLLRLSDVVAQLVENNMLPPRQAEAIYSWAAQNKSTRHPG